jgi:hypothetical protein
MQGETSPRTPPRGRRRILVIVIGVALVAAGVAIWWQFLRPRTIVEVLAFWSPSLALNGTARISLTENGAILIALRTLAGLLLGTFAGGSLAFSDSHRDGFLSTGDSFILRSNSSYVSELGLSFRYEIPRVVLIP